ncbi:M48 family metallopeptidase [Sulfitobacter donghicola]|uniref:Peptidase M48, Ste24p n=1 Tax=Sulfitobacter donghicola DSW-25 = KCTC 12864 = JCM 14565 TaxID=1300350 RepID=A0A073INC0_9RHOB|nr:M48 family metallopeptidase [Sulfitobacter donghicola]KEJ91035.1 peptidase M48, Ste24p [Sulfitobacter donghicola DSW-25 = KCTC 12864 = JCM 14565]KIN68330.1 Peptidase M48, Ste24p [Sulfitobacter donghicola DSW-25 = KCTC 12864 = JCM 14565]
MTMPPDLPQRHSSTDILFDGRRSAYFDGDSPVPQDVTLAVDTQAQMLEIGLPASAESGVRWPLDEIRRLDDTAGKEGVILRWTGDPLARLHLFDVSLLPHLRRLKRRAPPKGRGRLAAWAIGAVAAVALQVGVLVPMLADSLATYVPPAGERALGEATFKQIRQALAGSGLPPLPICEGEEGLAAFERMLVALDVERDTDAAIKLFVLDHEMVNAFALPGGYVVFFRGMIDAAQSPNEIAAVLAHEVGHVENRDPTRHALRSAGSIGILGLLFGDFAGGAAVLFLTEKLISANYAQAAEKGADEFAYEVLENANVSPAALGDMFERLRDKYGDTEGIVSHFVSHPTLTSRIDFSRGAAIKGKPYADVLSDGEWAAMQQVCD